jgi:hypothetical protein
LFFAHSSCPQVFPEFFQMNVNRALPVLVKTIDQSRSAAFRFSNEFIQHRLRRGLVNGERNASFDPVLIVISNEFQRHADKVRRWIVLHDTQIFGERGEDGRPGLLPAVQRFLNENPDWSVISHTQANHGLTVLSRDPRDKPALPGTIKMAANFTKSLAAHVADGLQKVEAPALQRRREVCTLCDRR